MSRSPSHAAPRHARPLAIALAAVLAFALALLLSHTANPRNAASPAKTVATSARQLSAAPVAQVRASAQAPVRATSIPARHRAAPATVRVRLHCGDTLWGLSRCYGTTVATLQRLNGLGHSTLIYAGRSLIVPAHTPARTAAAHTQARRSPAPSTTRRTGKAAPAPTMRTAVAIKFAKAQLGVPYVHGGTGHGGYDCSGLVQAAWRFAGIRLPRTTYQQINAGTRITRAQLRPGDLVFTNHTGHVQLYIGHGTVIEAAHPGTVVRYATLPPPGQVDAYVRIGSSQAP